MTLNCCSVFVRKVAVAKQAWRISRYPPCLVVSYMTHHHQALGTLMPFGFSKQILLIFTHVAHNRSSRNSYHWPHIISKSPFKESSLTSFGDSLIYKVWTIAISMAGTRPCSYKFILETHTAELLQTFCNGCSLAFPHPRQAASRLFTAKPGPSTASPASFSLAAQYLP